MGISRTSTSRPPTSDADAAPITRTVVLDQPIPPTSTHRVEVRRITIAAGHAAGLHIHNGPVFGSIESGSVVYQIDGEAESVLTPGDTFYEPQGARIARFDPLADGVTFLAYFLLDEGQEAEIEFPDAPRPSPSNDPADRPGRMKPSHGDAHMKPPNVTAG